MSLQWSCVCVCAALFVCIGKGEELCTNQWEVVVEGSNSSDLVVHHSSVSAPGRLYHLVWQWRGRDSPPAHVWVTRHARRGLVEGGFSLHPVELFPPAPPARLWWALGGEGEGGLHLRGRGDPQPIAVHPPWQVSICEAQLTWGINSNGLVYVVYGDVNVSRSFEEGWAMDLRLKRQAEFPTATEVPPRNGTIISWWRRLLRKFTDSPSDGTSKSFADWAEVIMKIFFTTVRHLAGKRAEDIPTNPDAEMIPSRFQADQTISDYT